MCNRVSWHASQAHRGLTACVYAHQQPTGLRVLPARPLAAVRICFATRRGHRGSARAPVVRMPRVRVKRDMRAHRTLAIAAGRPGGGGGAAGGACWIKATGGARCRKDRREPCLPRAYGRSAACLHRPAAVGRLARRRWSGGQMIIIRRPGGERRGKRTVCAEVVGEVALRHLLRLCDRGGHVGCAWRLLATPDETGRGRCERDEGRRADSVWGMAAIFRNLRRMAHPYTSPIEPAGPARQSAQQHARRRNTTRARRVNEISMEGGDEAG